MCVCAKHEITWTLSPVFVVSISTTGLPHDNARQQRKSCYGWPRNSGHESHDDTINTAALDVFDSEEYNIFIKYYNSFRQIPMCVMYTCQVQNYSKTGE